MQAAASIDTNIPAGTMPASVMTGAPVVAPVLSTGDWLITLIVLSIPLINIPVLLYWAVSSSENPNRKNFCKASLALMVLAFVLFLILAMAGAGR